MKKLLCLVLSVCLLLSAAAIPASAQDAEEQEVIKLVKDYLTKNAEVQYALKEHDLVKDTVSSLSASELEKAQKHLENSVCNALSPMIEIYPETGNYVNQKAQYRKYTHHREELFITNFSVVYGTPDAIAFGGLAEVKIFQTVGMRYPGLEQDSAVSLNYEVDLVETDKGWKISNVKCDDLFDQTHDRDTFDLETAIDEYNASHGLKHPFIDVPADSYFNDPAAWAYEQKITSGTGVMKFSPNIPVTRAQFVVMLWRLEGEPVQSIPPFGFNDIDPEVAFYYDAVMWATKNGIVMGISDTQFGADLPIKRQDIAVMLKRYYDYKNDITGEYAVTGVLDKYEDAGKITDYAAGSVEWAVVTGLINGKTDTLLCGHDSTSRAETVTILHRYSKLN